jgi:hypothetical protein
MPVVMSDEHRTLFAFFLVDENTDGNEVQVAELVRCLSFKFGQPSDELLHGHPLYGRGLTFYGFHEVEESSWLNELREMELKHPKSPTQPYPDHKHFVMTFHDSTLEAIAENVASLQSFRFRDEATAWMANQLLLGDLHKRVT